MTINIERISISDIDLIKPLWEKLNNTHKQKSAYFSNYYSKFSFQERKQKLYKSPDTQFFIQIAKKKDKIIGYCISTVYDKEIGEIDSIYIEKNYRNKKIGKKFIKSSLAWFDSQGIRFKKILVAYGNESVLPFYEKYGFFPKQYILEQKKECNVYL
ncbi:MAG: GNAT family N-acetyltransferase [Promethearchaeota archaeon]